MKRKEYESYLDPLGNGSTLTQCFMSSLKNVGQPLDGINMHLLMKLCYFDPCSVEMH